MYSSLDCRRRQFGCDIEDQFLCVGQKLVFLSKSICISEALRNQDLCCDILLTMDDQPNLSAIFQWNIA